MDRKRSDGELVSQQLAQIADRYIIPMRDLYGVPYAALEIDGTVKTLEASTLSLRGFFSAAFYNKFNEYPLKRITESAAEAVLAKCLDSHKQRIDYRVSIDVGVDGEPVICYDLGADDWGSMEVSANNIEHSVPARIRFRRADGMSQMEPATPGPRDVSVTELLQQVAPLPNSDHEILRLGFIMAAMWPRGPYPLLSLVGPSESGKGYHAQVIKMLVDPVNAPMQGLPYHEADLLLDAFNERILVLDNITKFPSWGENALCRISTGGALKKRKLYQDRVRVAVKVNNPVIITSTNSIITAADLVSRSMFITLPSMSDTGRQDETDLLNEVRKVRPHILWELLKIVQKALKDAAPVQRSSRITPMFRLMLAAEEYLGWDKGSFERAYYRNRSVGHDSVLSDYSYVEVLRDLVNGVSTKTKEAGMSKRAQKAGAWEGTYSELLRTLRDRVPAAHRGPRWPETPHGLAMQLGAIGTAMEDVGFRITLNTGSTRLSPRVRIERAQRG